jgi:arginine/serine-rich splicing factor 4/5/6
VSFADIDRDNVGDGLVLSCLEFFSYSSNPLFSILEYLTREDADRAVKQLDGKELRGQSVRVIADNEVR